MPKLAPASKVANSRAFRKLCTLSGIEPTTRQVRNLRNKRGPIYEAYTKLLSLQDPCPRKYDGKSERCQLCDMARSCFTQTYKELFS